MTEPKYNPKTHLLTKRLLDDGSFEYEVTPLPEALVELKKRPDSLREINLPRIRGYRNILLKESDWTQLPDAPVDKAAWAEYRQALRDFPTTCDPVNPVWPTPPQ